MNCKLGVLAYVVNSHPDFRDWDGRVVKVVGWDAPWGEWVIEFEGPLPTSAPIADGYTAPDMNLRPISGLPLDDETPIETNVPEALRLALGIESRWSA